MAQKKKGLNKKAVPRGMVENLKPLFFSKEFAIVTVIFLLILISFVTSSFWGFLKLNEGPAVNLYFNSYDKIASNDTNFCFDVSMDTQSIEYYEEPLTMFINEKVFFSQKLDLKGEAPLGEYLSRFRASDQRSFCFPGTNLKDGDNVVQIKVGGERIFYHIEKLGSVPKFNSSLILNDLNVDYVSFTTVQSEEKGFYPASIYVNGKLDHKVYPSSGATKYFEKITVEPGQNKVSVVFFGEERLLDVTYEPVQKMNPLVGLLLFTAGIFVFMFFVYTKERIFEKVALSFVSEFFALVAIGFILNWTGTLSLISFLAAYALLLIVLIVIFRNNFGTFQKITKDDIAMLRSPIIILMILGAIAIPLFFNIFTVSNYSYWNTYYERHAATLAENFSMPLQDELSYLGRPLGFIPGYFYLDAALAWLFGLSGIPLFAIMLVLANLLFLFALYSLGEALGFTGNRPAIVYILLWAENFVRGSLVISPRHAITLALVVIAISLLITNRRRFLAGVAVALSAFIQFPTLVAFPFLYLILTKKIEWKALAQVIGVALLIFGIFFLPNFLNFGMLTQAESSNWGYLINYGAFDIIMDIGVLVVFFFCFTLFDVMSKSFVWDSYKKKLFIAAIVGILFQIFISYRWNIFNAINIAVFLVIALPDEALNSRHFVRVFSVLLLIVGLMTAAGIGFLSISNYVISGYDFIGTSTSSSENVLTDPLFSHDVTYFSDRKVLADLAVEYAPEAMLLENFEFLEQKDYNVLEKYDIKWTFTQSQFINRKAYGNDPLDHPLEFEKLDKVFSNGLIYIHWVPNASVLK